ncbi:MAG: uroporphyrinogen methyltransferase / synthase [Solirubrobacteraceae bacterium]|jgi:uroporphyrinogen III methyltransferase/synthase|nr:uroporphyrinogen methyltransferase / synthase [Solirubrobacteraceae bacterium]
MTVYLAGAGPGDLGLMTARSLELIARADVILYDRLIPDGALDGARPDAELIDVGKVGGGEQVPQQATNELMLARGRAGREVVRLKGGDPFVFGRGGEEAQLLRAAGIAFEVVPGVTAGVAAPAYAGIPVTQRGVSAAVAFVTGHEDPDKEETQLDWRALASFPGTLVFYMGVRKLERIASQLVAAGRHADEPVAVVQRGTFADQRTVAGTLSDIAARAAAAAVRAPAITIVGPVAALHGELSWFGAGPLAGRTVAVTRARAQASALAARLRALGARVVEAPAIRIEPVDARLPDLAGFDLLCVTSPNGARRLLEIARDARALAGPAIAAIGPGTADALRAGGIAADIVPQRAVAESLVEALAQRPIRRALIARAEQARDVLPDALRGRCAEVEILTLYRTVPEPLEGAALSAALGADYLTFTSASAVRFFLDAAGAPGDGTRLVSIGPITTAAMRERGLEPHVEAAEHTPEGLVAALLADVGR